MNELEYSDKKELIDIINKLRSQNHNLTLNNINLQKEVLGKIGYVIEKITYNKYDYKIEALNDLTIIYNDISKINTK